MLYPATKTIRCQIGWMVSRETGEALRVGCDRYGCRDCSPRKARRFVERIRPAGFNRLITFTQPPGEGVVEKTTLARQALAWRRTYQWLRREYRMTSYAWVREIGRKTSRLHLHVVARSSYVPQRVLSKAASRYGFGRVVDIRRLRTSEALNYVAKYLTKTVARLPRGARRTQTTVRRLRPNPAQLWSFFDNQKWNSRFVLPEVRRRSSAALASEGCAAGGGACGNPRQREFFGVHLGCHADPRSPLQAWHSGDGLRPLSELHLIRPTINCIKEKPP